MGRYNVSLELAEDLKNAGYPQDSSWYVWAQSIPCRQAAARWPLGVGVHRRHYEEQNLNHRYPLLAAPTTDELLERLYIDIYGKVHDRGQPILFDRSNLTGYEAFYGIYSPPHDDYKLPEALAMLWLWCKEHGYLAEAKQ